MSGARSDYFFGKKIVKYKHVFTIILNCVYCTLMRFLVVMNDCIRAHTWTPYFLDLRKVLNILLHTANKMCVKTNILINKPGM